VITEEQLANWFTYHAPTDGVPGKTLPDNEAYEIIRKAGRSLALAIRDFTPESADQTAAIRKVREAVMTANAAIACKGK